MLLYNYIQNIIIVGQSCEATVNKVRRSSGGTIQKSQCAIEYHCLTLENENIVKEVDEISIN